MILPFALPLLLGMFLLLLVLFVFLVELRILGYAYRKIGVPARYMFVVMLASLFGSLYNIKVTTLESGTIVLVNVGGALVPTVLSIYLFLRLPLRGRM